MYIFYWQVICLILCGFASIVAISVAVGKIRGKNVNESPLVIFSFWAYTVFSFWCLLWNEIWFWKEHLMVKVVNYSGISSNSSIDDVIKMENPAQKNSVIKVAAQLLEKNKSRKVSNVLKSRN
jgi:hypothetical protein